MPPPANTSVQLLRNARQKLSEAVDARLGNHPLSSAPEQRTPAALRRLKQIETQIDVLAACIKFRSRALLTDYICWGTSLPADVSQVDRHSADSFRAITDIVREEFPVEAATAVRDFVQGALELLTTTDPVDQTTVVGNPHSNLQKEFLSLLLATRRDDATRLILDAVAAGVSIESVYVDVFQASQHEVGRLWQTGQITVAEEHYCTAATQFVMAQLQPTFLTAGATGKRLLVAACVGDELHEIGLRIVSDLFEVNGWNTLYLGANVPVAEISKVLVSNRADVLAISTTMIQNLFEVAEVIAQVRSQPECASIKVLVGGYPFNVDTTLWQKVGANAGAADGPAAIRVAEQWLQSPPVVPIHSSTESFQANLRGKPDLVGESRGPDDLSRLNNTLMTLQRELHKANLRLATLNHANQAKAEALQEADRRKDEFVAILAHELRGPLAPMQHAVSLLQTDAVDQSARAAAIGVLDHQLRHMSRLISDLLDVSRIAHGKIDLQLDTLSLKRTLVQAIAIVQPIIHEKQHTLRFDMDDAPIRVLADEVRLTQIVANVLTNAAKYTDNGGTITLSASEENGLAVITVIDDGIGIEANRLADVFSTFSQGDRSRGYARGGLGLGLSLVKQLVELHHGTVEAASDGPGMGSTFTIRLPVHADAAARVHESPADEDQSIPRRILVVDDSPGTARITACLFETLGHKASVALDGKSAIERFREFSPEIVLLDIELPDMSGMEVTRRLRGCDTHADALIVALTGHSEEAFRREALESGCDEFLVKPVDVRVLKKLATHPKLGKTR